MRLVVLFVGLLSLLFLNSKGYSVEQTHQNFEGEVDLCCFESGHAEAIWGFEKTESNQLNVSDPQILYSKKRNNNTLPGISGVSTSQLTNLKNYNPDTGLPPNFFQHYHSTQSLLQVFLL